MKEFTGVFIPAHIWDHPELIPAEKMMLGEIAALSVRTGWCSAGRGHFEKWLKCKASNVTYYTQKMEKMGFIEICRTAGKPNKMRVVNSRFFVNDEVVSPIDPSVPLTTPVSPTDYHPSVPLTTPVSPTDPKYNLNTSSKENLNCLDETENFKKTDEISIEQLLALETGKPEKDAPAPAPPTSVSMSSENPVEDATQIAVNFMQRTPGTVQKWTEDARWTGTPADLVNEMRKFFSHYMAEPHHISYSNPEQFFKTRFPGWLHNAKQFAKPATNKSAPAPNGRVRINDFTRSGNPGEKMAF